MTRPVADRLGVFASTICAMHCALVALLPVALGAAGLSVLGSHELEWTFTLVAAGVATFAFVASWRRNASPAVLSLLGAGITGLFAARFIEESGAHELGTMVAIASGFLLVLGHLQNLRAPTSEPCCVPE